MNIVYEHDGLFDVYQLSSSKTISKKRFFTWIDEVLLATKNDFDHALLLLDESRFQFYSFTIECTSRTPFSISELKAIIAEKIRRIGWHEQQSTEYCKHLIENCKVEWKSVEHCVGKTGNLSFSLHCFLLKQEDCTACKQIVGTTFLDSRKFTIVPKTLYLIQYLVKALNKKEFSFVTIEKKSCKFISVQNWFYHRFESVNMGESLVQACYKEHDIQQYLYEGYDRIETNDLLKKLVYESLSFYSMQFCNRLQQFVVEGYELLLMSNMISNPLFVPALQEYYHKKNRWFIVPLNTLFKQNTYVYNHTPNEIPVVAAYMLQR